MGQRRVLVNGVEIEAPDRDLTVRELKERAGIGQGRVLAEVQDAGTMRRLRDDDVLGPKAGGVYANLPDFGYGA